MTIYINYVHKPKEKGKNTHLSHLPNVKTSTFLIAPQIPKFIIKNVY
jgi:hypothetical protein